MNKTDKINALPLNELVRVDSSQRAKIADGLRSKKQFLENDKKTAVKREKVVNKERRKFLDMVKNAGVSTSLLKASSLVGGVFASRHALAQGNPWGDKKVVYVYLNNGATNDAWLPGSADNMNYVSQPYAEHGVAHMMNFRQLNVFIQGHNSSRQAMGDPQGVWHLHKPTMDARIAEVVGATSPYPYLYVGADVGLGGYPPELMTGSSLGSPIDGAENTFNAIFNAPPPIRDDRTFESMFAFHDRALASIKNKLSQEEKERIDNHAGALEVIEKRLIAQAEGEAIDIEACKPQGLNYGPDIVRECRAQADILVAALQCGLTKVVTLQVGNNKAHYRVPDSGYGGEVHDGACHSAGRHEFNNVMRHQQHVPAYFLKRLTEATGADGNKLIDSTVFCVVNCTGDGQTHAPESSPWGLATGLSGFSNSFSSFERGNTFDFHGAVPRGLGIPDSLYETMGEDDLGLLG